MIVENNSNLKQKLKLKPKANKSKNMFQSIRFKKHKNAVHMLSNQNPRRSPQQQKQLQGKSDSHAYIGKYQNQDVSWVDNNGYQYDDDYQMHTNINGNNEGGGGMDGYMNTTLPPPMHAYNAFDSTPMTDGEQS